MFSRSFSLSSTKILPGMQQHDVPVGPLTTLHELAIHGNDFLDSQDTLWEGDPDLVSDPTIRLIPCRACEGRVLSKRAPAQKCMAGR